METRQIAQVLNEIGTMLELHGENPFRVRAYQNASQALRGLPSDLTEMIDDGSLDAIPGIGEGLLSKITQLVKTGHLLEYDELRQKTPPGLIALLRVPGLGPKKIRALHEQLKIESLAELRKAAESGQIETLKGFGKKTAENILKGLQFIESTGERILQSQARRLVAPILEALQNNPDVIRVEVCGSLRRRANTIGDLDLLIAADDPAPVLDAFVDLPNVAQVLAHGPTKASVRLAEGVQCDLRGVRDDQFAFALHYFTGSKAHNIAVRRRAQQRGLKLSEYGLEGPDGPIPCQDEAALFEALGLHYIPPELREEVGELAIAEAGPIPTLVDLDDLTGTFHCHTDWSDGGNSLEEMAEAAMARGLKYLGIADHSRSAGYAGGLSIDQVKQQWDEIDELNDRYQGKFRLYKGTECDILPDGSLDYPDDLLEGFDYVVASVHSRFGLSQKEMTERICRAVRHPLVTMLGHPTGRLLLARAGYQLDLEAVIAAAAESGTMIEINANSHRLDLDAENCRKAKAAGVSIVINPDAHTTGGLDDLFYGIGVARRAGLEPSEIVNTASPRTIAARLGSKREGR